MSIPPIKLESMQDGDILILKDGTSAVSHMGIATWQFLTSYDLDADSNATHVGLYDSDDKAIAEASGAAGLRTMPLSRKRAGYCYECYRYVGPIPGLVAKAYEIARDLIDIKQDYQEEKAKTDLSVYTEKGGDNYSEIGCYLGGGILSSSFGHNATFGSNAALSLAYMKLEYDRGFAKHFTFYCSNFVVSCYQLAELAISKCSISKIAALRLAPLAYRPEVSSGVATG